MNTARRKTGSLTGSLSEKGRFRLATGASGLKLFILLDIILNCWTKRLNYRTGVSKMFRTLCGMSGRRTTGCLKKACQGMAKAI